MESLDDVGGYVFAEWRVEPRDVAGSVSSFPPSLRFPVFKVLFLLAAPALTQCIIVERTGFCECCFVTRDVHEASADIGWNVLEDVRWVIGLAMDVEWSVVWLPVGLVPPGGQAQRHVQEIGYLQVGLYGYLQLHVSEDFDDIFPDLVCIVS